ncbi:hypothetical protein QUB61_34985, partial [Microcoleus sp. C2D2]
GTGSSAHPTIKNNSCGMGRRARPNYFCQRSIVLANKGILVTRNYRDFSQVPGLLQENWTILP